jgi:5-formyltetrahydrofolate cyclo-ligase
VVIVPLLGVDEDGYRLGNGGGFYDRTLARLGGDVLIIGVGQAFARMKTIFSDALGHCHAQGCSGRRNGFQPFFTLTEPPGR